MHAPWLTQSSHASHSGLNGGATWRSWLILAFCLTGGHLFSAEISPEQKAYDDARREVSAVTQQVLDYSLKARVHALFSHLDEYIREGDLLPGEYCHPWSTTQRAYEFLPKELAATVILKESPEAAKPILPPGRPVRVLVRKYRRGSEWLVGAWAPDGKEHLATVTIPELGEVTLAARPGASVYLVRKHGAGVDVHLCDPDEAYPSRSFVPPPWWTPHRRASTKSASRDLHLLASKEKVMIY